MIHTTYRNCARTAALAAAFFLLHAAPRAAADSAGRGPKLLQHVAPKSGPERASIRVNVDMALVPVTVVDPLGRNVVGLQRENFVLFDDRKPRRIVSFGGQDAPVSVGVIFDSSRSMTAKLPAGRGAVAELLKQLNPEDESFLVGVADRPEMTVAMSSNTGELSHKLLFTRARGLTPLIDGVYLGLHRMSRAKNPRRALVVVSDGGDNNSRYTFSELMAYAQEADIQIYTIGLVDNPNTPEEAAGAGLLASLAERTGGRAFAVKTLPDMQEAMTRIGITLHNEYVLGYYPPDDAPAGKYRKIEVELNVPQGLPRLQIHARQGYYTPSW